MSKKSVRILFDGIRFLGCTPLSENGFSMIESAPMGSILVIIYQSGACTLRIKCHEPIENALDYDDLGFRVSQIERTIDTLLIPPEIKIQLMLMGYT